MTTLEELEKLLAEATPSGDWSIDENTIWSNDRGVPVAEVRIGAPTWYKGPKLPYASNAALIVAAINALPGLLESARRVEELQAALEEILLSRDFANKSSCHQADIARAALKVPS
jgi:hypothetical protein